MQDISENCLIDVHHLLLFLSSDSCTWGFNYNTDNQIHLKCNYSSFLEDLVGDQDFSNDKFYLETGP